ncbi:MAG TPA: Rieske 2Fe-2S domain-containing protein [Acidimicrobiia bacterium]|nr:Rieske 2Fe-2S domain-containing protein [Acidimicrobiia bacterium]
MSDGIDRREFLSRGWKAGVVMIGCAGAWTSWDLLRPLPGSGLGGVIKTIAEADVFSNTAVYVRSAQAYLTKIDGAVVALWQKCPHLGCRVPWCESSGQFECPCHGSAFNRAGEYRSGPSPRGMDRFAVTVSDDGIVEVDTGAVTKGVPAGTPESIDEPPTGESCT